MIWLPYKAWKDQVFGEKKEKHEKKLSSAVSTLWSEADELNFCSSF